MKDRDKIPRATIERLPLYYRCLDKMDTFEDVDVVSSKDLGGKLDIPSTQVRKDLSYYGEFGRQRDPRVAPSLSPGTPAAPVAT
ncbi:MAG: winged-helix domain-containing protein [Anaerolineae bacterium]